MRDMEIVALLKRKIDKLERRLSRAEARTRALERVVKNVVGEASARAFEFAVEQYGWHELHEMNERAMRDALRERCD